MKSTIRIIIRRTAYFFLALLCVLGLTGGLLWWSLQRGIELDRLTVASVDMAGLTLRLDRGIILRLGQLTLPGGKSSGSSINNLESLIPRIRKWGHLIREIDIDRLSVKDQVVGVTYQNGSFQVRGDMFTLEAVITYEQDAFRINLTRLAVKPYDVTLSGTASYTRSSDTFLFTGSFSSPRVTGTLSVTEIDGLLDARISTDEFTDLVGILEQFRLDRDLLDWLSQNISAESYRVTQLRIRSPLKDLKNIGTDNITGTAVATSATVRFHPDLAPVKCERINISYQADLLSFALEKPTYRNINLAGSEVHIDHLIQDGSQLVINLKTETVLQEEIIEILDKYDIDFPARQKSGTTKADLSLVFDLPRFTLRTKGSFTAGPGAWRYRGIPVRTDGITIRLHNNIVTIQKAEISYQDILRTHLSGTLDTSGLQAELLSEIEYLDLKNGSTVLLQAADMKIPLQINLDGNHVQVRLKEQDTTITLEEDGGATVDIRSLPSISALVPLLRKIDFSGGNAFLSIENPDNINFSGNIDIPNTILTLDETPVTRFRFEGTRTPSATDVSVNGDEITASFTDKLMITLQEYLVTIDTNTLIGKKNTPALPFPLEITGPKINLKVKEFLIPARKFELKDNRSDISLKAQLEKGYFLFESSEQGINFVGTELDAKIAEKFIHFADFTGGTLNVSLKGDMENYKGYIEFNNVLIKDYALMNNILAFLNTIPALATLSSPGFDEDGYRITEGIVYFELADKVLNIRHLRADGITVNCEAEGWINFNDSMLEIDLELITMKNYSYLVNKIPLAGYAILGEDGALSTSLKIDGSLANPSIKTFLARDITMTPFNIIKRTFEWPFRMLDKINGPSAKMPEPDVTDSGKAGTAGQ
jgi:hypothetical protein